MDQQIALYPLCLANESTGSFTPWITPQKTTYKEETRDLISLGIKLDFQQPLTVDNQSSSINRTHFNKKNASRKER